MKLYYLELLILDHGTTAFTVFGKTPEEAFAAIELPLKQLGITDITAANLIERPMASGSGFMFLNCDATFERPMLQ
jgi:hypothetical protein